MTEIDKKWFFQKLDERQKSVRGLARHLSIDPSAASRMLSGTRRMKMEEANQIALFLGVSLSDVLNHAGVSVEPDGTPTRILLAAVINEAGSVERLKEPRPLPQAVIDRAKAAVRDFVDGQVIAAQVRAASGPLSIWDDAVILFGHTDEVEATAIGVLSICRTRSGEQIMAKVERARKTGEARIQTASGATEETLLDTATPVLAVIP